ncbi:MAG: hypothetical protein ACFFB5_08945 [Promethearchaeota archaeon]
MKLDEDNPCPHCGNTETLTDRSDKDFRPVIPRDLQFDFQKEIGDEENVFVAPTPQETYGTERRLPKPPVMQETPDLAPKRVSQDIPLEEIFPTIENATLDPASQKVYFQLSIEFQIILNKASNYRQGLFRWNLLLPDRLQEYGLTEEAWHKIAAKGDGDEKIQEQLNRLLRSIFG